MRKGAWLVTSCALGALAVQCGGDEPQANTSGSTGGDEHGGTSGDAGEPATGGRAGSTTDRGGTAGLGGTPGRGGTAGRGGTGAEGGSIAGEAGAPVGGHGDLGGSGGEAGGGEAGTGGTGAGGESGRAGEGGGAGEPGCQDPPASTLCRGDLSGVGTGDFEVKFTIRAGGGDPVYSLIHQRAVCDHAFFWSARLVYGSLSFEIDDEGPNYVDCWSPVVLNDVQFHRVVVRRVSGVLSIVVDCGEPWECSAPTSLSGTLPPLGNTTNDPCLCCGATELQGRVTDQCVRPL